jgi:DnaJ-class molecular chaperone
MICPDCDGFGFVVGELVGGQVKCLSCGGSGHVSESRAPDRLAAPEKHVDTNELTGVHAAPAEPQAR